MESFRYAIWPTNRYLKHIFLKEENHLGFAFIVKMSTATEVIVQRDLHRPTVMKVEQKRNVEIDYNYFFTSVTKSRGPNYLKIMSDKLCSVRGRAFKFSNGVPNSQCFPYEEITVKLKNGSSFQINGTELNDSLGYGGDDGYQPFVDLMKSYQERLHHNIDWNKKSLTTVAGCLAGLHQVMELFVSPGDPVLLQTPLYTGVISILEPLNVEYLEIDSTGGGICAKTLEKMLKERKNKNLPMPKIFCVNPIGTNPTGDIMSNETKKEIYKIACQYNLLILEDDPYFLIRFEPTEEPISFLSMDTENRVIRLDSFSKTLAAGFRVGCVTAAKEIIERLNIVKQSTNICPPFTQMMAYKTLMTLDFEGFMNHTKFASNFYRRNSEVMLRSLDKHLKDLATWIIPKAALFVWIDIKNVDHISDSFVDKCIEKLVFLAPGFPFYAKQRKSPSIRLAFSMVNEDEIEEGIEIFARLVKEELLEKEC